MSLVHHWDVLPRKTKLLVTCPLEDGLAYVKGRKVHLSLSKEGGIVVIDGPLTQPLADYVTDSGKNQVYDIPKPMTALEAISQQDRTSFVEVFPSNRKEAMKVAVLEADTREEHARKVLDLKSDLGKPPIPIKVPAKNTAGNDTTLLFGTPKLVFEPLSRTSQRVQETSDKEESASDHKTEEDMKTPGGRGTWFSPASSASHLIPSLSPVSWARSRPNQQNTTPFQPPEWAARVLDSCSPETRLPQTSITRALHGESSPCLFSRSPIASPHFQSSRTKSRSVGLVKPPLSCSYSKRVPAPPTIKPPRGISVHSPIRAPSITVTHSPHPPAVRQTYIGQSPGFSSRASALSPEISQRANPLTQIRSWTSLPQSPNILCDRSESSPQLTRRVGGKEAEVPLRSSMPQWKGKQFGSAVADSRRTVPPSVSLNNVSPPAPKATTTTTSGVPLFGQRIMELERELSIERRKNSELEAAKKELQQKNLDYRKQLEDAKEAQKLMDQRDMEEKELEERIEMIWKLLDNYLVEKGDIRLKFEEQMNDTRSGTLQELFSDANRNGESNGKGKSSPKHSTAIRKPPPRSLRNEMLRRVGKEEA